jgi:hypothetical protein
MNSSSDQLRRQARQEARKIVRRFMRDVVQTMRHCKVHRGMRYAILEALKRSPAIKSYD